jgi:hypothetical protein
MLHINENNEGARCSQRAVIGWVTKKFCLELLRAPESTLSF